MATAHRIISSYLLTGAMMDDLHLAQQSADKRVCNRIDLNRKLIVELEDGKTLECITKNVSLGGVLVQSSQATHDCHLGQDVKLFLAPEMASTDAYHCKIVRISNKLLGLKIDKKAAARFGKTLTKGVFVRK